MKHACRWFTLAVLGLFASVGSETVLYAQAPQSRSLKIGTYVTTVTYQDGSFDSREVMTFYADHTMAVVDSGQGGPTYFFSSQLGSWKWGSGGTIVARAIGFDFAPNQDIGRLDYTVSPGQTPVT